MSGIGHNRRMHKFLNHKFDEHGMRDKEADQLIDELAKEGRSISIY